MSAFSGHGLAMVSGNLLNTTCYFVNCDVSRWCYFHLERHKFEDKATKCFRKKGCNVKLFHVFL